jgi:hypothetical protein
MAKFRKKPVEIEATQWLQHGDHPSVTEVPIWHEDAVIQALEEGLPLASFGFISTLEGGHVVRTGDWIITGVKGEKYPCKPDIFEMTYDKAD